MGNLSFVVAVFLLGKPAITGSRFTLCYRIPNVGAPSCVSLLGGTPFVGWLLPLVFTFTIGSVTWP